jgi:hypothetical protein
LAEVATIISVVNGLVELSKFAYTIYQHLSENKASIVTVQTPLRTLEIRATDAVSEESIAQLLQKSLRL